jgi:hypothetical protein
MFPDSKFLLTARSFRLIVRTLKDSKSPLQTHDRYLRYAFVSKSSDYTSRCMRNILGFRKLVFRKGSAIALEEPSAAIV